MGEGLRFGFDRQRRRSTLGNRGHRTRIKSPADLKNKKIGVSRYGSLTDMALREALRHYNLNPDKDVTILQTGGEATRFAALTTGAIDGAMLSGDKLVQAEKLGYHVTIDLSKLPIYYPVNGVIASKKFLASNRDAARGFLRAWVEGIKAFKTDKELSIKVLAKYLKIQDRDDLGEELRNLPAGLQEASLWRPPGGEVSRSIKWAKKFPRRPG